MAFALAAACFRDGLLRLAGRSMNQRVPEDLRHQPELFYLDLRMAVLKQAAANANATAAQAEPSAVEAAPPSARRVVTERAEAAELPNFIKAPP